MQGGKEKMFLSKFSKLLSHKKNTNIIGHTIPNVHNLEVKWDKMYNSGEWNYLSGIDELAHYSVIIGYCEFVSPNALILDVGCGEGLLAQRLEPHAHEKYIGIDISNKAIEIAEQFNKNCNLTSFAVCDAESYIPPNTMDIIIFNESLYYFNDLVATMQHYDNFLNTDGHFIISMFDQPESDACWDYVDKHYDIIDAVKLSNKNGLSWNCKLAKRSQ